MQNLSNSENTLLGMVTAAGVAFALQPTLYYKNAAQQGLEWKLFAHPTPNRSISKSFENLNGYKRVSKSMAHL